MFSGLYGRPFSRLNLSAIACLSSGKHGVGVYLVWPLSSDALAASLMKAGVSKSGSPAPKRTTSMPCFCMALAFAPTARVMDSEIKDVRSARGIIWRKYSLDERVDHGHRKIVHSQAFCGRVNLIR